MLSKNKICCKQNQINFGAVQKARKACRCPEPLKIGPALAIRGIHTAENEPQEVPPREHKSLTCLYYVQIMKWSTLTCQTITYG